MSENQAYDIIVVGASAAGLRAAARARRLLSNAKILVIDEDTYISYAACGMPYYISGDIENADKLRETAYGIVRDPEYFRTAKGLEVIIDTRVERIDRDARKIYCHSIKTGEDSEYSYDKLVLAMGASPVMLPMVPKDSKRITTLKTLHDAIDLRKSLERGEIKKVGIVGGGFIGCELAESFGALWGVDVVLIEAASHILSNILDTEMASAVEEYIKSEGVKLYTDCPLQEITESEEGVTIKTSQGAFEVDRAVIAVGVRPNGKLAEECGLKLGKWGGIVVDDKMATSDPNIFAAGDCVEMKHMISGKPLQLPLGSLANRQGRVVGSNLGGGDERFRPVVGSAAAKIFDMNVASTGLTEVAARNGGFDAGCVWGTLTDKPDYYPESQNVFLKLVYDKGSGRLLGLQGYSKGEVVKRVDVFAALLKHNGHLEDLLDMEFAYAPPYAPAVDPLFSLGAMARNAMLEGIDQVRPDTPLGDSIGVDVRQPYEVESNQLSELDCQNIPLEELREKCEELCKDRPLLAICEKGVRSSESVRILKEKGFTDVKYLGGGMHMKPAG